MTTETPAAVLRAAAEKLRTEATSAHRASPAPWETTDEHVVRCADGMVVADRSGTDHPGERADLPYIATMDPSVGLALADWLDAYGLDWDRCPSDHPGMSLDEHALVVARRVLGTTEQADTEAAECGCDPAPHREDDGTYSHWAGCPVADAEQADTMAAPAVDRAGVLKPTEREFLGYALDLAADRMASRDGFTDEDEAALDRLRRLAAEAQQPEVAGCKRCGCSPRCCACDFTEADEPAVRAWLTERAAHMRLLWEPLLPATA